MLIDSVSLYIKKDSIMLLSYRKMDNRSPKGHGYSDFFFSLVCFLEKITVILQWKGLSTMGTILLWNK